MSRWWSERSEREPPDRSDQYMRPGRGAGTHQFSISAAAPGAGPIYTVTGGLRPPADIRDASGVQKCLAHYRGCVYSSSLWGKSA